MKQCFIDVETTGLNPEKHAIIQLSGKIVVDDAEVEEFNFLVRPHPKDLIDQKALDVNGRTIDEIMQFEPSSSAYMKFIDMLSIYVDKFNNKDKFFFIGYNSPFDSDFVRQFMLKQGDRYYGSWFWTPDIDVMRLAGAYLMNDRQNLQDFKLGTVANYLGIEKTGELHDAMVDISLTQKIYKHITK